MAWRALAANKMRTLLTMLGIIIGIASVVSIVVVGDAAKQMVLADIRSIGTNTIDVYPGKDFGDDDPQYQQALKYDDLIAIQKQPWVASATPAVSQNLRLRYNNVDVAASANGVSGDYFNVYGMTFRQPDTVLTTGSVPPATFTFSMAGGLRTISPSRISITRSA